MPRRVSPQPDAQQHIRSRRLCPDAIDDPNLNEARYGGRCHVREAKNDKLSMVTRPGLIDIQHQKYEDARTELDAGYDIGISPDPVDYYLLATRRASQLLQRIRGCLREVRCEWPVGTPNASLVGNPQKRCHEKWQVALYCRSQWASLRSGVGPRNESVIPDGSGRP